MTLPTNKACEMADEREYFINLLMRGGVYKRGVFKSWATYTFTDHDTMRLVEFLMALRTTAPPVTREAVLEEAMVRKLRSSLRFAASHSCISSADEKIILAALKSEPVVDQEAAK